MATSFVLFDLDSGNALMSFASEREAWESLESMASDEGMASLHHLSLMKMDADGPTLIAMEDEIVQHVLSEMGANAVPR